MKKKRVTLSFDNGPTEGTAFVLETLARYHIKSTFFLVGKQLLEPGARKLALEAKSHGHWIGNHTFSHDLPLGDPLAPVDHHREEIGAMEEALTGLRENVPLFRPYAGKGVLGHHVFSTASLTYLRDMGYTVVLWNSVPRDWELPAHEWVNRALADVAKQEWTSIVLHDRPNEAMTFLPSFLETLQAQGVEFRQDFPPDCLPLRAGIQQWDLDYLTQK